MADTLPRPRRPVDSPATWGFQPRPRPPLAAAAGRRPHTDPSRPGSSGSPPPRLRVVADPAAPQPCRHRAVLAGPAQPPLAAAAGRRGGGEKRGVGGPVQISVAVGRPHADPSRAGSSGSLPPRPRRCRPGRARPHSSPAMLAGGWLVSVWRRATRLQAMKLRKNSPDNKVGIALLCLQPVDNRFDYSSCVSRASDHTEHEQSN